MTMKHLYFFTFCIFLISSIPSKIVAQHGDVYFELNVSALLNDKAIGDYSVLVYEDGKIKDSLFTKKIKPIQIALESNKVYSVAIRKDNLPIKIAIVNTLYPKNLGDLEQEPFELQIEISPDIQKLKQEYEDYPVAILLVNKKKKLLMASEAYFQQTRI
jgi:hypothetical protein